MSTACIDSPGPFAAGLTAFPAEELRAISGTDEIRFMLPLFRFLNTSAAYAVSSDTKI